MDLHPEGFNLEVESLRASGINDEREINIYIEKLDRIYRQFITSVTLPDDDRAKAELLFGWLWREKPDRYKPSGSFRLSEVIDAQLSFSIRTVGNCLGLTLLYNCLLRKMGIFSEALYIENAFGRGPHVLTLLSVENSFIEVENILPDGFDYKGHLDNSSRVRWGEKELVADIYHSVGNELFFKGAYMEALRNYDKALYLNPRYEKARMNRLILLGKMGTEEIDEKNAGL